MGTEVNAAPVGLQPPDDLISARKAARILGVHFATLYRWMRRGKLTPWAVFGLVRVSEAEVRAIVKRKPVKAAPVSYATDRQQARQEAWAMDVLRTHGH
jgi:excisionase family DNA binding protein